MEFYRDNFITLHCGDVLDTLKTLPAESVQTCVTSPPYFGLRDYQVEGQIGLEESPDAYVQKMVAVFREVRRVLKDDGTCWINLGDSYSGSGRGPEGNLNQGKTFRHLEGKTPIQFDGLKPKDLIGTPWRVAFALQADGWFLRQDIIWHKPNPMPESVKDRCTKAHEYIFLLSKSQRYYFDNEAIAAPVAESTIGRLSQDVESQLGSARVPGKTNGRMKATGKIDFRNKRSVWTVTTRPYKEAHFATFPPKLIEPCVLAGAPEGETVLDPFAGSGTTLIVAKKHGRKAIGIDLNPEYCELAKRRIEDETALPLFDAIGGQAG